MNSTSAAGVSDRPFRPSSPFLARCTAAATVALLLVGGGRAQCTEWTACGSGTNNTVLAVAGLSGGQVVAGGVFSSAGGSAASRIARWDGATWSALGSGTDNAVRSLAVLPNGDIVAAGDFAVAGGAPASRIARWDGSSWHPLGSGVSSASAYGLYAVAAMPNGDVVAGGYFQTAGGVPAAAIARWNGSAWSPLGSGCPGTVFCLLPLPNGDLIAGGNFSTAGGVPAPRIARWNGSSWSSLGSGITGFRVNSLAQLPNGDIVAGGAFTAAGGVPATNLARWNGSSWSAIGSGANGDVLALEVMPDGDLLAGGQFTSIGGTAAVGMARWNGSTWASLGTTGFAEVYSFAKTPEELRIAGGFFFNAGGTPAAFVATYGSTCPAEVSDDGGGCPSSGGANQLSATTQPWGGSVYRTHGSGLPATCVAIAVTGFDTTFLPLASVLPPSPVGCNLRVSPDVIAGVLPIAGALDLAVALPESVLLYGIELYQQLVLLELNPGTGALVETTASNVLRGTVGIF